MPLETDLRAALARKAGDVPADAAARLRAHDYRVRTRRVRPTLAAGALAGSAGTAAAVAAIVGLGAGAAPAFAGWTATPTTPTGDQTANADAACQARLSSLPGAPSLSGLEPALTDTRGPFTFVIFAGANGHATCISGPSFTSVGAASANGASGQSVMAGSASGPIGPGTAGGQTTTGGMDHPATTAPPAGQISLALQSTTSRDGSDYSFVEGRAGTGVSAVTLDLSDGTQVTASVSNGWFAAWWPGTLQATSASLTTATGTSTQPLAGTSAPSALPGLPLGAKAVRSH